MRLIYFRPKLQRIYSILSSWDPDDIAKVHSNYCTPNKLNIPVLSYLYTGSQDYRPFIFSCKEKRKKHRQISFFDSQSWQAGKCRQWIYTKVLGYPPIKGAISVQNNKQRSDHYLTFLKATQHEKQIPSFCINTIWNINGLLGKKKNKKIKKQVFFFPHNIPTL